MQPPCALPPQHPWSVISHFTPRASLDVDAFMECHFPAVTFKEISSKFCLISLPTLTTNDRLL